jgi:hypothetical protein
VIVPILAGESGLGALFSRDRELLGRQLLAPLLISLFDFSHISGLCVCVAIGGERFELLQLTPFSAPIHVNKVRGIAHNVVPLL